MSAKTLTERLGSYERLMRLDKPNHTLFPSACKIAVSRTGSGIKRYSLTFDYS